MGGLGKIKNMTEAPGIRTTTAVSPSVRRITVADYEDESGVASTVVDLNRYNEASVGPARGVLRQIRHFEIPVHEAVLEAWAVFERDLLSAAVWLGIASAPMTKNSWRNLVSMDRSELISRVVGELLAKDAPLLDGFEDRALELRQLRNRIATRKIVYQANDSEYLVLSELTGPGRGLGDLIPYMELHDLVDVALRLDQVLRSSVVAVGGDSVIFDHQTEYSAQDAARLEADSYRSRP